MIDDDIMVQWKEDCAKWRDRTLTGRYWHWCAEWDSLPMDETCPEWPCGCSVARRIIEAKDNGQEI